MDYNKGEGVIEELIEVEFEEAGGHKTGFVMKAVEVL